MTDTKAFHIPLVEPVLKRKTALDILDEANMTLNKAYTFRKEAVEATTRANDLADERSNLGSLVGDMLIKHDSFTELSHQNRKLARKMQRMSDRLVRKHDRLVQRYRKAKQREVRQSGQ